MSAPQITLADIQAGRLRESGHMNYGPNGSGYPMQHTTIPRLSCIDRIYKGAALKKAGVATARLWCVDGVQVESLEEAIKRLNVPPDFTDIERAIIDRVPADWTELHPFLEALDAAGDGSVPSYELMFRLRHKGAVQVERREDEKKSFIRRSPEQVEASA